MLLVEVLPVKNFRLCFILMPVVNFRSPTVVIDLIGGNGENPINLVTKCRCHAALMMFLLSF